MGGDAEEKGSWFVGRRVLVVLAFVRCDPLVIISVYRA